MRPTPLPWRLLSALLMAVAAIAQPGEALAHGVAHHHEAEHHADGAQSESLALSSPDHGHDHAHGVVADATIRHRVDPPAVKCEVELPEPAMRDVAVESPSARAPLSPGDRSTGPPPRLRAPPAR